MYCLPFNMTRQWQQVRLPVRRPCAPMARLSYLIPDNGAFMVSTNSGFCKRMLWSTSGPFLPHSRSLTYERELIIVVCHAEGCLPVDFARGGVAIAVFRERGEMGDGVWQPETLRAVKEQDPCRRHASCFWNDLHASRLQFVIIQGVTVRLFENVF